MHIIQNTLARGSADGTNKFQVGQIVSLECTEDVVGGPWGYLELWESCPKIRGGPGT